VRWTFPARLPANVLAQCVARWPTGRWLAPDDALARGVPAPLRKRLHEIAAIAA